MKSIFKEEWIKFRTYYQFHFIWMAIIFFIFMFLSYKYGLDILESIRLAVLSSANSIEKDTMNNIETMFESKGLLTDNSFDLMFNLFINNTVACLTGILIGLIPVIVIPTMITAFNGAIIGVLLSIAESSGFTTWKMFVFGVLPHGITEMTAMFLATAMGSFISINIIWWIIGRKDKALSFKEMLEKTGLTFVRVVIPLLFISALIESFITPTLITLFIGN